MKELEAVPKDLEAIAGAIADKLAGAPVIAVMEELEAVTGQNASAAADNLAGASRVDLVEELISDKPAGAPGAAVADALEAVVEEPAWAIVGELAGAAADSSLSALKEGSAPSNAIFLCLRGWLCGCSAVRACARPLYKARI